MKKVFTPEFWGQALIQFFFIGIVLFFLHSYYQNKWTPLTAAETLKKENLLNAKKDVYFEALLLINRSLSNTQFITNGVLSDTSHLDKGGKYPNVTEINVCISKLAILSNTKDIPLTFIRIFHDSLRQTNSERTKFINLVRKDIADLEPIFDPEKDILKFIVPHKSNY